MVDLAPSPFFVALPPVKTAYKPGTVTHTCKSRYLRGWDQEDRSSRLAQANSLWDSISKITRAKWTDCVAQTVEHLFCKYEALSSKPSPIKKKKKDCIQCTGQIPIPGSKLEANLSVSSHPLTYPIYNLFMGSQSFSSLLKLLPPHEDLSWPF
jgi:hypothetical protein